MNTLIRNEQQLHHNTFAWNFKLFFPDLCCAIPAMTTWNPHVTDNLIADQSETLPESIVLLALSLFNWVNISGPKLKGL